MGVKRPEEAAHAHWLSPDKELFDNVASLLSERGVLMDTAQAIQSSWQHAGFFITVSYDYCNFCYYDYCYLLLQTPAKTHMLFFLPA